MRINLCVFNINKDEAKEFFFRHVVLMLIPRRLFLKSLSANVEFTPHDTVVTSDRCNSGHKIMKKSMKFPTKWCNKLCNLLDLFLRNCVIVMFHIF